MVCSASTGIGLLLGNVWCSNCGFVCTSFIPESSMPSHVDFHYHISFSTSFWEQSVQQATSNTSQVGRGELSVRWPCSTEHSSHSLYNITNYESFKLYILNEHTCEYSNYFALWLSFLERVSLTRPDWSCPIYALPKNALGSTAGSLAACKQPVTRFGRRTRSAGCMS